MAVSKDWRVHSGSAKTIKNLASNKHLIGMKLLIILSLASQLKQPKEDLFVQVVHEASARQNLHF